MEDPEAKGGEAGQHHHAIEAVEGYRKGLSLLPRQPVAGEGRNDPPADQRHQQQQDRKPDAPTKPIIDPLQPFFQMYGRIPQGENGNRYAGRNIAPVPGGNHFARDQQEEDAQKGEIDDHRQLPAGPGREEAEDPSGNPDKHEQRKGRAGYWWAPSPGGNCREKEAGDRRYPKTIDGLVQMPRHGSKGARQGDDPEVGRDPQSDRKS